VAAPCYPIDELELAVGTTVIATTVVGAALIGFEAFTASRMAVPFAILGLIGIPRASVWAWPLLRRPAPYVLLALTTPWIWNALRDGYPPAGLFQWYYWDLGRALSQTHGIPSYVTEFGGHVRWLPDYLVFNIAAETYHGVARLGSNAEQLSAFRISLALLGIVAVYGTLRLWIRSWTALAGTALVVATLAFADKFNTFKPESYGIVLGLIVVRLGVRGVRRRDPMCCSSPARSGPQPGSPRHRRQDGDVLCRRVAAESSRWPAPASTTSPPSPVAAGAPPPPGGRKAGRSSSATRRTCPLPGGRPHVPVPRKQRRPLQAAPSTRLGDDSATCRPRTGSSSPGWGRRSASGPAGIVIG
jgi:hypothetical protein